VKYTDAGSAKNAQSVEGRRRTGGRSSRNRTLPRVVVKADLASYKSSRDPTNTRGKIITRSNRKDRQGCLCARYTHCDTESHPISKRIPSIEIALVRVVRVVLCCLLCSSRLTFWLKGHRVCGITHYVRRLGSRAVRQPILWQKILAMLRITSLRRQIGGARCR